AFYNFGKSLSYKELDNLSLRFAAFLQQKLKLEKGERVAIILPNLLQYPIALMGILRAGLVVVNTNPLYTAPELAHQLKDSGAKAVIILENFAANLQTILPETVVEQVIVTQIGDMLSPIKGVLMNLAVRYLKKLIPKWSIPNAIQFKTALAEGKKLVLNKPLMQNTDIAFLQYTGGTTGISKGAILTHRNLLANLEQAKAWLKPVLKDKDNIIITALPLYHVFSLTANCLTFFKVGGKNVLITNPRDMNGFVKELSRHHFNVLTGVNTLYNGLLQNPNFAKLNFSHLLFSLSGGMALQKSVAIHWQAITNTSLIEAYGLTETSPGVCINPLNLKAFNGCIGMPISSTDISLRDEEGKEVPILERGELWVKGPQVMKGYWNNEAETALVLTPDGWLKTGDIAIINELGYLKIVDRKKDMILVSGFNVYPNEVEDVIALLPGILEVAVVGINHPVKGEQVKAFIVLKDKSLTKEKILEYCHRNLTNYKVPKEIEFRDNLPKNNVGKILRRELRSLSVKH
ncbi:MAG: Long chain fatty-acid CoA ligase, partial [Francisellaceae bacterium]|nr:Long chain fatty-acid CoA ligase [Francisellaceae bacterium]